MTASAIQDADALPLLEAERASSTTLEIAAGKISEPRTKIKRPRPTFDDGSATRVFKFPSKTYPRSSYYVTSTEIIVRIKKARKKWKLVIPKKRVTAYRTNRWFAKPRWVEIELTYTQASRLGLVEPRAPAAAITSATPAKQEVTGDLIGDSGHTLARDPAPEAEPSSTPIWPGLLDPDPNVEQAGRPLSMEPVDVASTGDDLKEGTVFPSSLPHDDSQLRSAQSLVVVQPRAGRAAPRASAFLPIASSALVSLSIAAAWIALSGSSTTTATTEAACAGSEQPASPCTQRIVTGATGKVDQPQSPEPRLSVAFAAPASSEPISMIEPSQVSAPPIPEMPAAPAERDDDSAKAQDRVPAALEAAPESDPLPEATSSKASLLLSQDVPAADCHELRAASQSISISFDYASSHLSPAILPALESFAERLRSCPSAKVIIEGHTDSDGHPAWNQSLSVHRATAVLERLVHAGVPPSQMAAVGFGQSRPYAPNVSAKNKRSNRRVALVVDVLR